jgi:hypothetical protein
MSRILKVSGGNYRISVQGPLNPSTGRPSVGGNIILDTVTNGPATAYGQVTILGNLDVQGALTYIETTNTQVKDNVLQLNYGESGSGITAGTSGIEISRGALSAARFVFDESIQHYNTITSTEVNGTFVMRTADGTLSGLQVGALANDGTHDFVFDLQNQSPVLKIVNTNNYYQRVTDDNHIPNKKFVTNYVAATGGVADVTNIHYPISGYTGLAGSSQVSAGVAGITVSVGANTPVTITSIGTTVGNILINGNFITGTDVSNPVVIGANGNQNVEITTVLKLDNQTNAPSYASDGTRLYASATVGPGKTGVYFTNTSNRVADELISRNRAVLLSILL